MTKPSDFSPVEALEVSTSSDAKQSRGTRWMLRIVGAGVLLVGWLAVSLQDIGQIAFVVYTMIERLVRSIATTLLMEDAGLEPAIVASFGVSGYPWGSDTIDAIVQQAESEIAAQSGPDNEQGSAMDIPKVSRRPGQNVSKPNVHQT